MRERSHTHANTCSRLHLPSLHLHLLPSLLLPPILFPRCKNKDGLPFICSIAMETLTSHCGDRQSGLVAMAICCRCCAGPCQAGGGREGGSRGCWVVTERPCSSPQCRQRTQQVDCEQQRALCMKYNQHQAIRVRLRPRSPGVTIQSQLDRTGVNAAIQPHSEVEDHRRRRRR